MVYVDELRKHSVPASFAGGVSCHMVSDSLDELHKMADTIGLKRKWFQDKSIPHYDLSSSKRTLAIIHGAAEISSEELVTMFSPLFRNKREES